MSFHSSDIIVNGISWPPSTLCLSLYHTRCGSQGDYLATLCLCLNMPLCSLGLIEFVVIVSSRSFT